MSQQLLSVSSFFDLNGSRKHLLGFGKIAVAAALTSPGGLFHRMNNSSGYFPQRP